MAIIFAFMSMVFWGISLFLAAVSSRKIGNVLTLFWMQIFGFIAGSIYLFVSSFSHDFIKLIPFLPILTVIGLLQVIGTLAYYKGMEKGQVSLVSPLGASYGLVVAIMSIIFLGDVLKINQIAAIFLIIFGIIIIALNLKDFLENKSVRILTGTTEGITAMLGWGVSLFLLIFPSKALGWFLPTIVFRLLIICFLLLYIRFCKISVFPKSQKLPLRLLIFAGLFDIVAFFSYSLGVSQGYGSIVAPVSSASTLVTIFLGVVFLREKIDLRKFIGIAAIVGGLVLISV